MDQTILTRSTLAKVVTLKFCQLANITVTQSYSKQRYKPTAENMEEHRWLSYVYLDHKLFGRGQDFQFLKDTLNKFNRILAHTTT